MDKKRILQGLTFFICGVIGFFVAHSLHNSGVKPSGPGAVTDSIPVDSVNAIPDVSEPASGRGYAVSVEGLARDKRSKGGVVYGGHTYPHGTTIDTESKLSAHDVSAIDLPDFDESVYVNRHVVVVNYKPAKNKDEQKPEPVVNRMSESEATSIIMSGNYDKLRGASLRFSNFDAAKDGERPTSIALIREKFQFKDWRSVTVTGLEFDSKGKVTGITMTINR